MAKSENYKIFEKRLKGMNFKRKRLVLIEQLEMCDEEIMNEKKQKGEIYAKKTCG